MTGTNGGESVRDILVNFPGGVPEAQLLTVVPLDERRYRVECWPPANPAGIGYGDEIETIASSAGQIMFAAIVEKAPCRTHAYTVAGSIFTLPNLRALLDAIVSDGGAWSYRDGQLVVQLPLSSAREVARELVAMGVDVLPERGLVIPVMTRSASRAELARAVEGAVAILLREAWIAHRNLAIALRDLLKNAGTSLSECASLFVSTDEVVARQGFTERARRVAGSAMEAVRQLERHLARRVFPGYSEVLYSIYKTGSIDVIHSHEPSNEGNKDAWAPTWLPVAPVASQGTCCVPQLDEALWKV